VENWRLTLFGGLWMIISTSSTKVKVNPLLELWKQFLFCEILVENAPIHTKATLASEYEKEKRGALSERDAKGFSYFSCTCGTQTNADKSSIVHIFSPLLQEVNNPSAQLFPFAP